MTTARHAPATRPPDLTSVSWDGEHNPGFVQPAGSGLLVLAARPCVTAAPDPNARPVTALGVLLSLGDPATLTISLLHLTRYGWHGAGPALPLRDALNGRPYPGVTCPAYPDLLRGAARLLDAPRGMAACRCVDAPVAHPAGSCPASGTFGLVALRARFHQRSGAQGRKAHWPQLH